MTGSNSEPTGRPMPREGDPTPRQVREAMRALHQMGHDFTYKQAWTLVRAEMRQQEEARAKEAVFALLDRILNPRPMQALWEAKLEIEHAIAHYRG